MNDQFYLILTTIILIFIYIVYHDHLLSKKYFIAVRLGYYAYWYWLLYSDISKYIIVYLTFGYLIITSFQKPTESVDEKQDKVNTYILGYRRGYERGIEFERNLNKK